VQADVPALVGREAVEHAVVEVDELLEHVLIGPRVPGVVLVRQPTFGEVHRHASRTGSEALTDVLLALIDAVGEEGVTRVPGNLSLERIQEHHHRRSDHCLLDGLGRDLDVLLDELGCVALVPEGAAGDARQLTVMAIVEDGEVLAVEGEVVGGAGPRQGVREVIGRETRLPVLTVGDVRLAGRLQPLDRVLSRRVLRGYELLLGDLALVVIGVGLLQLHRPRQGSNKLSRNRHRHSSLIGNKGRNTPPALATAADTPTPGYHGTD
jgi:hypothetical protein